MCNTFYNKNLKFYTKFEKGKNCNLNKEFLIIYRSFNTIIFIRHNKEEQEITAMVIDTKTEKKEFIYLNLEKESDMPIRRECPKIILNLLSDTDDENSQEWRKQCHKSLQIKRKLLKLDGLPEGTRIQFPSLLSFSNGVEKGDSIILLKSNRKWIWEKYQYRFMKSYINPDYTILQKEEIK